MYAKCIHKYFCGEKLETCREVLVKKSLEDALGSHEIEHNHQELEKGKRQMIPWRSQRKHDLCFSH